MPWQKKITSSGIQHNQENNQGELTGNVLIIIGKTAIVPQLEIYFKDVTILEKFETLIAFKNSELKEKKDKIILQPKSSKDSRLTHSISFVGNITPLITFFTIVSILDGQSLPDDTKKDIIEFFNLNMKIRLANCARLLAERLLLIQKAQEDLSTLPLDSQQIAATQVLSHFSCQSEQKLADENNLLGKTVQQIKPPEKKESKETKETKSNGYKSPQPQHSNLRIGRKRCHTF